MSDSNTKSRRQLGPVLGATLTCQDIDKVSQAYIQQLDFTLVEESTVSEQLASFWQAENLVGNRLHILKAANGDAWLRLLEDKNAKANQPLKTHGWMSLETNVGDVDAIAKQLQSDFEVIGAPAYLQVSDAIKAMQVIGPAGEVSYLTQVEREVPPFELPMTKASSGSLFIPVLSTPNREQSLAFYEALHQADQGLKFPTKVTVLNNAWGKPIDHQYDVATLQLAGKTLFELTKLLMLLLSSLIPVVYPVVSP